MGPCPYGNPPVRSGLSEVEFSQWKRFDMKKSRLSDSQIMEVLKRANAGIKVPDLCRELGVSPATLYK